MQRFLSAFLTTVILLPVVLWVFLGISIFKNGYLNFTNISNFIIFACMVYFTFFIAYIVKRITQYRIFSYFLIPFSLVVMMIFTNSWEAQFFLFFIYMGFMGYYFRKEKFDVYLKQIDTNKSQILEKFQSKKEAKLFIRSLIDERLKKLLQSAYSESELIESYFTQREVIYLINKKEFNEKKYLLKTASTLIKNKQINIIDEGFKITKDENILELLNDISNCEVVDLYSLRDFIEIEYIKEGKRKYLSLKESYYADSQIGKESYFIIEPKRLDEAYVTKEYNKKTKSFKEKEYLKSSHKIMDDIYFIVNIFYFERVNESSKEGKIELIYKNKKGLTNSYRIYVGDRKLKIDKYKNIFEFHTKVLDDTYRTQLQFSYNDKFFEPKRLFDTFEIESNSLIRKIVGDFSDDFPCTTFGKKIRFGFNATRGICAYNLSSFCSEYQLVDHKLYSYLNKKEKEKLHRFLAIAQLYLNNLFVNKEFENTLILDTSEYLEHHNKIMELEKSLENSNWKKECYYTNEEQGLHLIKSAFIYYDKNGKEKKFVILQETDYIDTKYVIKYNDNINDNINYLFKSNL